MSHSKENLYNITYQYKNDDDIFEFIDIVKNGHYTSLKEAIQPFLNMSISNSIHFNVTSDIRSDDITINDIKITDIKINNINTSDITSKDIYCDDDITAQYDINLYNTIYITNQIQKASIAFIKKFDTNTLIQGQCCYLLNYKIQNKIQAQNI